MARAYAAVLEAQHVPFLTVGRGEANCAAFEEATGHAALRGGVDAWLQDHTPPAYAIVAVNEAASAPVVKALAAHGVARILVEKPGGRVPKDIRELAALQTATRIFVAYNRRFYASTRRAQEILSTEGGVTSFHFDFTEWPQCVAAVKDPIVKAHWFLANSTHVVDLAFFLGGAPMTLHAERQGSTPWHPAGAVFTGSGVSTRGAPFSYHANWNAPGRWSLEVHTRASKLIFRPLEKLQRQRHGSVAIEAVAIDAIDEQFKPGLYRLVEAFLSDAEGLPSIQEHAAMLPHYLQISGEDAEH